MLTSPEYMGEVRYSLVSLLQVHVAVLLPLPVANSPFKYLLNVSTTREKGRGTAEASLSCERLFVHSPTARVHFAAFPFSSNMTTPVRLVCFASALDMNALIFELDSYRSMSCLFVVSSLSL